MSLIARKLVFDRDETQTALLRQKLANLDVENRLFV